jgi:hypothetical protein
MEYESATFFCEKAPGVELRKSPIKEWPVSFSIGERTEIGMRTKIIWKNEIIQAFEERR